MSVAVKPIVGDDYKFDLLFVRGVNVIPQRAVAKTDEQGMIDRVREIERDCAEKHGEFDWELLSEEVKDEYDNLCLQLDKLHPTGEDAPPGDFGWRQYKAQRIREVLELFRQRKVSTQKAANLIGMTHSRFTRLASRHGIYTSTSGLLDDELLEAIFGKGTA